MTASRLEKPVPRRNSSGRPALWICAAAIVLAVHAALGWAICYWQPDSARAAMAGNEPITIDLEPVPVAPEPQQEIVAAAQPEAPQPEPLPPEEPEPEPPPETAPVIIPAPKPPPKPHKDVQRKPEKPRPARSTPSDATTTAAESAQSSGSAASASAMAVWQSSINERIARAARSLTVRSPGTASVIFSVSPSGQVMSVRIGQASGDAQQDSDATAMIKRLSPFPAPPAGTVTAKTLRVPINFKR